MKKAKENARASLDGRNAGKEKTTMQQSNPVSILSHEKPEEQDAGGFRRWKEFLRDVLGKDYRE